MSYDISFKVKVDGVDAYVPVGACDANITWNVRKIIEKSTGLEWKNCQNNGLCVDVIPKIEAGLRTLEQNPDSFKEYEEPNGWGTVKETAQFFRNILNDWNDFQQWYEELVPVTTFWTECWLLTEATGLTQEEIKAPFTEDTMINLAEQALGVEPSKVYETDGVRVYEHTVREVIYETAGGPAFDKNAIGKSIFLTRAEAERALQEMEGKKDG